VRTQAQTREAIITVAAELLVQGVDEMTILRVGALAGISTSGVYRYASSRAQLATLVAARVGAKEDALLADAAEHVAAARSIDDAVSEFIEGVFAVEALAPHLTAALRTFAGSVSGVAERFAVTDEGVCALASIALERWPRSRANGAVAAVATRRLAREAVMAPKKCDRVKRELRSMLERYTVHGGGR
jgi:AcrR family transcriptional regulator